MFQCASTFDIVFVVLSSKILKQMPKANSGPSVDSSEIRRSPEVDNTPFNCGRNHLLKYLQYFWDTDWLMVTMLSTPNATQKKRMFFSVFPYSLKRIQWFLKKVTLEESVELSLFKHAWTILNTGVEVGPMSPAIHQVQPTASAELSLGPLVKRECDLGILLEPRTLSYPPWN